MGTTCRKLVTLTVGAVALATLAACDGTGRFNLAEGLNLGGRQDAPARASGAASREGGEDVEAPEVFAVTAEGLWDGRPSLGGIWVAHPDVSQPERVIIRNPSNGNSVIGALFRRERDMPGPPFQISSDAATALGLLAGEPRELDVTALRRQEPPEEVGPTEEAPIVEAPEEVTESMLDPDAIAADASQSEAD